MERNGIFRGIILRNGTSRVRVRISYIVLYATYTSWQLAVVAQWTESHSGKSQFDGMTPVAAS